MKLKEVLVQGSFRYFDLMQMLPAARKQVLFSPRLPIPTTITVPELAFVG